MAEGHPTEIRAATLADTEALVELLAGGALTVPETRPGPGVASAPTGRPSTR